MPTYYGARQSRSSCEAFYAWSIIVTRRVMATITEHDISRDRIAGVERIIRPHIRRTPVIDVDGADFGLDPVLLSLKLELLQHSGSFKARGAFTNLLTRRIPKAGVVAASGGNHG